MGSVTTLRDDDRPAGNFHRLLAGERLALNTVRSGIIKIVGRDDGAASSESTVIDLPLARAWLREVLIVDAAGEGFTLILAGTDQVLGDIGVRAQMGDTVVQFRYRRPALQLVPLLSDSFDERDGWVAM